MQAKIGRPKEFENSLLKLRGKDADITDEAREIQVCVFNSQILISVYIENV